MVAQSDTGGVAAAPAATQEGGSRTGVIAGVVGVLVLGAGALFWGLGSDETQAPAEPSVAELPSAVEPVADEPQAPAEPEPLESEAASADPTAAGSAEPAPVGFEAVRNELLGTAGTTQELGARIWTDPSPVPDNAEYQIGFEAGCDCDVLLFAIDGQTDEISLLYPNPYEPGGRLAEGSPVQIPSSEAYALRAVGGQGMDILKLLVTPGKFDFAVPLFGSWGASPAEPERADQLAGFLASLEGREWSAVATPLQIVR